MASCEIFIDTSGLYALVNRRDSHHAAARTVVERLIGAGRRFVASGYTIAESVNLANARGGAPVAVRIIDLIEQSTAIRLEWIAATRFDATKTFFRKHADHAYSFTDCTSFVLMREHFGGRNTPLMISAVEIKLRKLGMPHFTGSNEHERCSSQ